MPSRSSLRPARSSIRVVLRVGQRPPLNAEPRHRATLDVCSAPPVREQVACDAIEPRGLFGVRAAAKALAIHERPSERLGYEIHGRIGLQGATREEPEHDVGVPVIKAREVMALEHAPRQSRIC